MDLPPASKTVYAQRDVELSMIHFLKAYCPSVYALWSSHPDADPSEWDTTSERTVGESTDDHQGVDHVDRPVPTQFLRHQHTNFLTGKLEELPESSQSLYAAQPWLVYWVLQAADMLGITTKLYQAVPPDAIAEFLHMCLREERSAEGQDKEANISSNVAAEFHRPMIGFSGGTCAHAPHLAASYAACCALCILGDPRYLRSLPRGSIKRWLFSLQNAEGSFRIHWGGESDVRASYCVAVLVTLLQLDDPATFPSLADADVRDKCLLSEEAARFILSCQTHEGGFCCGKYASEAHGAYTQCGLAALLLMKQPQLMDSSAVRRWLVDRQLSFEGGFNGRTNKLVDSCYSHWIGASHVLLRVVEAYSKLHGVEYVSETGRSSVCLRAREVALLDHAQLVDAQMIGITNEACWEAEEERGVAERELVERFISADDQCLYEEKARIMRWRNLPGTPGCSVEETEEAADFVLAEVGDFYFNQRKLQQYVLRCCQNSREGGLMDKPGASIDSYHTCYSLSGLSSAQNLQFFSLAASAAPGSYVDAALERGYLPGKQSSGDEGPFGVVLAIQSPSPAADVCLLRSTNPAINIHRSRVLSALRTWGMRSFL